MKSSVRQFITSTWLFAVFVCHNPATDELVISKHIIVSNAPSWSAAVGRSAMDQFS